MTPFLLVCCHFQQLCAFPLYVACLWTLSVIKRLGAVGLTLSFWLFFGGLPLETIVMMVALNWICVMLQDSFPQCNAHASKLSRCGISKFQEQEALELFHHTLFLLKRFTGDIGRLGGKVWPGEEAIKPRIEEDKSSSCFGISAICKNQTSKQPAIVCWVEWHFLWRAVQPLFQPLDMWCSLKTGLTVSSSKGYWGPRICILYILETWQLSSFCMSFCKSIQCDSGPLGFQCFNLQDEQ